jgi:serine/threonine-protein kinase
MTLGQIIDGRYRIGDKIGVGGMSTVYMGRDIQTGQTVAVKLMDEKLTDDPDYLARFEREAQVGVSLNHPGIAKVFAYGKEGDTHFLVMEYVQGITLTEYVRKKGLLPFAEGLAEVQLNGKWGYIDTEGTQYWGD